MVIDTATLLDVLASALDLSPWFFLAWNRLRIWPLCQAAFGWVFESVGERVAVDAWAEACDAQCRVELERVT